MRRVHGFLGRLGGGPSCEHSLLGGLAIRFVWGLGEALLRFLDLNKICGIFRRLYGSLGTESVTQTVWMDLPVPN